MANNVTYRDLDLNFTKHPLSNDVSQSTDTASIKKAIRNLLSLKRGEKPFHPEINSGIYDSLFDLMNPINISVLRETILQTIQIYEKRVIVNNIDIRPNLDGNEIAIRLELNVITTQAPVIFTVNLERTR